MNPLLSDNWRPASLSDLVDDVLAAVESGDIDSAFDNVELTSGHLSRAKNIRDYTKNFLRACLQAGVQGVSEAKPDTALGLVNAYRHMNAQAPLDELPAGYKVVAIKLFHDQGNPDVEIYIKEGDRVLYGEKVLPRGILMENFLLMTASSLS